MNTPHSASSKSLHLEPDDAHSLATLCGQHDRHLRQIESQLQVRIHNRGNHFQILGEPAPVATAERLLQRIYQDVGRGAALSPEQLHLYLKDKELLDQSADQDCAETLSINTRRGAIKPRGEHQAQYIRAIQKYDINFAVGPAGTGKTWLAVACAVEALKTERAQRIVLVRPAVEAGEKLGFLPGDLAQKVDPYLRPLYDALFEMLGFDKVAKLIEQNIIEVAPLAFMRGRTLNNAFIILDESQNTTREQMKMFLTRIGFGSTAVITGDITQIDLPRGTLPGLKHAMSVLEGEPDISFTLFDAKDVVRHSLVQRIVEAYQREESRESGASQHP